MFSIGSRVTSTTDFGAVSKGMTGTVVYYDRKYFEDRMGVVSVEWDTYIDGHTCKNRAKSGYGYDIFGDYLELICENEDIPDLDALSFESVLSAKFPGGVS